VFWGLEGGLFLAGVFWDLVWGFWACLPLPLPFRGWTYFHPEEAAAVAQSGLGGA